MRFVRHAIKESPNDQGKIQAIQSQKEINSIHQAFPKIEEYFMYTPMSVYPTGNPNMSGSSQVFKIAKDAITYCPSGLVAVGTGLSSQKKSGADTSSACGSP